MWKYVTRRIRDALEKSVNHFDKRSSTGVVNSANNSFTEDQKKSGPPSCWLTSRKCWKTFYSDNNTNSKKWNFDDLNRTWIGAITWSSALVVGWYASQLLHLKYKYKNDKQKSCLASNCLFSSLHPYIEYISKNGVCLNSSQSIEKAIANVPFHVQYISNENDSEKHKVTNSSNSGTSSSNSLDDDLGEVLNSIENRLGLAAIENGQHKDGLNLLRSAANRNHAPALFNLGLCYEIGLGVAIDEKTAMELYRLAAAQQHPGALYNLGVYYGQGRGGLTRDTATGKRLLRLAAVQGHQDAVTALKGLGDDLESTYHDKWTNRNPIYPPNDDIVPTQSVLFC